MTEEEFYERMNDWLSDSPEKWNHVTLTAYFCSKYLAKYGVRFKLVKSKVGPTLTKETKDFAKVFKLIAPDNYDSLDADSKKKKRTEVNIKIKHYIDWMFDYKFKNSEINGTMVFLKPSFINEFERMYQRHLDSQKKSNLIGDLVTWIQNTYPDMFNNYQLETEKDFEFLKSYCVQYNILESEPEMIVLNKAIEMGFVHV